MVGVNNEYLEARVPLVDRSIDKRHDKGKRHSIELEYLSFILGAHIDEAMKLVKMELLANLYKYMELSNPRSPIFHVYTTDP